ncbi:efflux RND transporter periplasmic adaptor subunit [Gimesia sp.]|uniref:efflux RND transporter periplasmic adaptor subunit n=1 Tax=Gimesia sp. TaxID=2024833 RepID=UPI003A8E924E
MPSDSTRPTQTKQIRVHTNRGRRHRSLHKSMLRCTLTSLTHDQLLNSLIEELTHHCQPVAIVYYSRDASSQLDNGRLFYQQTTVVPDAGILSQLKLACTKSVQSKEVEIQASIDAQLTLYAAPVTIRGVEAEALGVVYPSSSSTEPFSLLLQTLVSHIELWRVLRDGLQSEEQARDSAAIVELLSGIARKTDLIQATQHAARELADYLGCRQIAIGIKSTPNSRCRLIAISDTQHFDKASPAAQAIETALEETIQRNETACWSEQENGQDSVSLSLRSVCTQQNAKSAICVPLTCTEHELRGALCAIEIAADKMEKTRRLLEAAATPLANTFTASQRQSGMTGTWKTALRKLLQDRIRLVVLGTCLILSAILFVPWPYQVACECQLEPVKQRFIVAPFEGTLETMLVEPGDLVHQGDVLARMDPRELQWKRSGLIADRNQAVKRRDSAQAVRDYTTQQLARLEAERVSLELELIDHRINHLEIKSPVDGIVVAGSLNWTEGAPLEIGEALFEIAPLDRMIVEVAVPDSEISHVREGQNVQIRLEALPDSDQTLTLARIHPRAEIRDEANIFIAEAMLENDAGVLRPGMKGRARITTVDQPVYWILFHKPWNLIRKYLF